MDARPIGTAEERQPHTMRLPRLPAAVGPVLGVSAAFIAIRLIFVRLPWPASTHAAIATTSFIAFALIAPLACVLTVKAVPRHERSAWVLLALGSAQMAAGDAMALAGGGTGALAASASMPVATIVWASSFVTFFLATMDFIGPPEQTGVARVRHVIDIGLLVLIVAALVFAAVIYPIHGQDPRAPISHALMSYASLILSLSLMAVAVIYRPRTHPWHPPLALAFSAIAIGSVGRALAVRSGDVGPLSDLPWLLAYGMIALAGAVRLRGRSSATSGVSRDRPRVSRWVPIAVMSATFISMPAFVYLGVSWNGDPLGYWLFASVAALLGLFAVGRNVVLTFENTSLRTRALVDPLTGLFNHRFFQERLSAELIRSERERVPLSLACIDLDDFDQVNNVYGHLAGDRRLRAVATALVSAARSSDVVCRIGGDEFAIIMPDTDAIDAYKVCLRLQDAGRGVDPECPLPTGFSVGIAAAPEHAGSREDLAQKADGALYWAKLHGREQVVVYDPNLVTALGPEQRIGLLETESYVRMVQLLASAVDARDPYTQQHSRRVAALAVQFARSLGMPSDRVAKLETAALLHDVGKIGVSDVVLRKNDRLTAEEFAQVREHPHLAVRILKAIPGTEILPWILGHHERWDGRGYPDGLVADAIPLEARILAICDAFDAMTSVRPYRAAMPTEDALDEIMAGAGSQFDEELAERFVVLINDIERLAARAEGVALFDEASVA